MRIKFYWWEIRFKNWIRTWKCN